MNEKTLKEYNLPVKIDQTWVVEDENRIRIRGYIDTESIDGGTAHFISDLLQKSEIEFINFNFKVTKSGGE